MKNDPAILVVDALGGLTAVANRLDKDVSTVFRWRLPKPKGGSDGRIPASNHFQLWCELIGHGCPVSLEELIFTEKERRQISALRARLSQNPDAPSPCKSEDFTH